MSTTVGSLETLLRRVDETEAEYPVHEWRVDGIRVWPIVRMRLGYAISDLVEGRAARRASIGVTESWRRARRMVEGVRLRPPNVRGLAGTGGAVFLSDGISFVELEGREIDRFCEPLRAQLRSQGIGCTLLVPGTRAIAGAPSDALRIQRDLDRAVIWARLGRGRAVDLPSYRRVLERLTVGGLGSFLPSPRVLGLAGATVSRWADHFARVIAEIEANVGLVVEYYSLVGMSFVLGCRRAGIVSVDLQHGVQGRRHFAYRPWRLPVEGYELLPDRFAVWTPQDAQLVASWGREHCAADVIGNPYLDGWADETRQRPGRLAEGGDHPVRVLLALSGVESDEQVGLLTEAIRLSPERWFWAVRCHPLRPDLARWSEVLEAAERPGDAERASTWPLGWVLDDCDVLVTLLSSTAIDAKRRGLPVVVIGGVGAELLEESLEPDRDRTVPEGEPRAVLSAIAAAAAAGRAATAGTAGTWRTWITQIASERGATP